MNLNALHRRLLRDVLEIGNTFPFVITGGYAVQAHGLVDRLSRDRALADRGYPRDLVDIHAASKIRSPGELESLGRRCAWDEFSLEGLAMRLGSVQWRADEEFSAYGLSDSEIGELRRWAQAWADAINRRLYADSGAGDEEDEIT